MHRVRLAIAAAIGLAASTAPGLARAVDVTMAGSGALDYRAFVDGARPGGAVVTPAPTGIESMVFELSHKVIVDASSRLSVSVKACFGCHGIELDQGYAEIRLIDGANVRIGRINVPV